MALGKILIPLRYFFLGVRVGFGSCFGYEHWLDPFYRLFSVWKKSRSKLWRLKRPITSSLSAVGIGIFLILFAMVINIVSALRRKRYEDALFGPNGVAGLVFYASPGDWLRPQLLTGRTIVTLPYILCLIVLPLLVIFFREVLGGLVEHRPDAVPKKWGEFIVQNFFELFELLLTYAGNTISFLRVGALYWSTPE